MKKNYKSKSNIVWNLKINQEKKGVNHISNGKVMIIRLISG